MGGSIRSIIDNPGEQRGRVLELINREQYQDASARAIYAREVSAGRVLASVSTIDRILAASIIEDRTGAQPQADTIHIPSEENVM